MPGVETVAVGLYAEAGSRHEPARVNGLAHLFEHMVFKGAGGRSAREISEAVEDVGGDLNACDRPRAAPAFYRQPAAPRPAARRRADRRPRPAARISRPPISRARRRSCSRSCGEARDTPATSSSTISGGRLPGPAARPLGPRRRGEHRRDRASTTSTPGGTDHYRAGRPDPGRGRQGRSRRAGRARRGARSATCPTARSRRPSPAASPAAVRAERRKADQAHLAFAYAGAGLHDADYYAARLFADVVGTGASSRLFQAVREEQGLAYSVSVGAAALSATAACSISIAATARRRGSWRARGADRRGARRDRGRARPQPSSARARAQAKAGLLMSLESCWGQAELCRAPALRVHGRLVEPAEIVAPSSRR